MPTYSQANRPLAVTTPLGKDVLLLVGIRGHEAISQLFEFELELLAKKDAGVAFDRIVGQKVTVAMPLAEKGTRYFNGIVRRFEQGRRDEEFVHFRAELVPEFWLWTKKVQSRIFQHQSVPDILKQVLEGLKIDVQAKGAYQPRDYCVQYRESDFAFGSRLMEEEGIFYYFDHTSDSHTLVICDDPLQHPDVASPSNVIYEELDGGTRSEHRVREWTKSQEVRSGKYTLWDHHFELTGQNLESQRSITPNVTAGKVEHKLTVGNNDRLEIYDYPGGYAQRFDGIDKNGGPQPAELKKVFDDGKRTAKIRMEQESASAVQIKGASSCEQFATGHRFTLERHFDADGKYLLTSVEHVARLGDAYRAGAEPVYEYQNRFTAIPVSLPYRPPQTTPKPVLSGTQTATIVGLSGQELFLDKYGRVKVQFPWDRQGKNNADSSCWVRVSQLWAGNSWGAFFWPRVGHEVVVAFEEGDPDRPLVVGSVYNNTNMPPYELPKAGVMAGIKSCSVRGKPGRNFNQILFDDEPGDEYLQLHSEKYVALHNEHTQHDFMPSANIRVIGNMGLPTGSGGGGGLMSDSVIAAAKWLGANPTFESGQYQYVFGDNVQVVSRAAAPSNNFQWFFGTNMQIVVDPLSFLVDYLPVVGPWLELFGVNGNLQATLGNNIQLSYGVAHQITRGPQLTYNTSSPLFQSGDTTEALVAKAVSKLALLASFTGLVLTCTAEVVQSQSDYSDTRNDLGSATNWVIGFMWGLVVILEQGIARASPATKLSDEAANLLTQGLENPLYSEPHIQKATTDCSESANLLMAAVQKSSGLLELAGAAPASNVSNYADDHAFIAPDIGLLAIRDPQEGKASNIVIDAQGSANNGKVFITGSKEVLLASGPAIIKQTQDGSITLDTATEGVGLIEMNCGPPSAGASLIMNPQALCICWGPPGVGPSITLNAMGITMNFGAFSASLGPAGWTCPPNVPEIH